MWKFVLSATIVAVIIVNSDLVSGHGMLLKPVARGSAWRYYPDAPANYEDSELFCGGFYNQWFISGGKCGICGDSYQARLPRPHENGGTFGRGRIVERYATGQHIDVSVFITANHWGHFKFDLCNLQQSGGQETDACFQKHPLRLADGSNRYRVPNSLTGWFNTTLVLPKDVTCAQCVVRWTYTVGNSWGSCEDGSEGLGCGPQETFRGCSDVSITSSKRSFAAANGRNEFYDNVAYIPVEDLPAEFDLDDTSIEEISYET